jgi:hypothetical protein
MPRGKTPGKMPTKCGWNVSSANEEIAEKHFPFFGGFPQKTLLDQPLDQRGRLPIGHFQNSHISLQDMLTVKSTTTHNILVTQSLNLGFRPTSMVVIDQNVRGISNFEPLLENTIEKVGVFRDRSHSCTGTEKRIEISYGSKNVLSDCHVASGDERKKLFRRREQDSFLVCPDGDRPIVLTIQFDSAAEHGE